MKVDKMKIGKRYIPSRGTYEKVAREQISRLGITDKGEANAFKHAFSSALIARDWGEPVANALGAINELRPNNPTGEWAMDRHNNVPGTQTGKNKTPDTSDNVIADEIKRRLDMGQLITDPSETGYAKDAIGAPQPKSDTEILQDASMRMRNKKKGLPPQTGIATPEGIRKHAVERGAKLFGSWRKEILPELSPAANVLDSILAYFKKQK